MIGFLRSFQGYQINISIAHYRYLRWSEINYQDMKKSFIKNKSKKKIYYLTIYMIKIISYKIVCYKKYAKKKYVKSIS